MPCFGESVNLRGLALLIQWKKVEHQFIMPANLEVLYPMPLRKLGLNQSQSDVLLAMNQL